MNRTDSFFNRLCHSAVLRHSFVMVVALLALAWSCRAFCDEIHDAAGHGELAKVQTLLKNKPDLVFSKNDNGQTPLHYAAQEGHKDVVEVLLIDKADVNAKDKVGCTPLHVAAYRGHKDVVEVLLAYKADVNAKDNNGFTPLHFAAGIGHKDVVEVLLAYKADVNANDNNGHTPLAWAAREGHEDVVEVLRRHGGHE